MNNKEYVTLETKRRCVGCGGEKAKESGWVKYLSPEGKTIDEKKDYWYWRTNPFHWGPFCSESCAREWGGKVSFADFPFIFGSEEAATKLLEAINAGYYTPDRGDGVHGISFDAPTHCEHHKKEDEKRACLGSTFSWHERSSFTCPCGTVICHASLGEVPCPTCEVMRATNLSAH